VYFLIGLRADAGSFFVFMTFMILGSVAATSMSLMVSAVARTTDMAVTVLPMVLELARLYGGFFLPPINLPGYFVWLDAISYVKYAYVGISLNELQNLPLTCSASELAAANGQCPVTSGDQIIGRLGLNFISMGGCAGALIAYIVLSRVIAYVGIRFIKW
jgi:ABC-type multidrug transport system permease subunit